MLSAARPPSRRHDPRPHLPPRPVAGPGRRPARLDVRRPGDGPVPARRPPGPPGPARQRPAEAEIGRWDAIITAGFLVGAATGGVLFGWLGDRIGRVRAMILSVLTYALFSGVCGLSPTAPGRSAAFRFVASLGMGGEWSLGVALVMEVWPDRSRAWLAGVIGAAANVGYLMIAAVGLGLERPDRRRAVRPRGRGGRVGDGRLAGPQPGVAGVDVVRRRCPPC